MLARAFAKVNLTLEITGRRPDGYHELVSIMQTIDLADELELLPEGQLSLECDRSELATSDNLVLRAARVLGQTGTFRLRKRIPAAAGLGGGSSDAAAALRLLDAVYRLGLSAQQLAGAAAEVGSDVTFFLTGGTALVEGRGERVTALLDLKARWVVLLNPGLPLSTAAVFGELAPAEYGTGGVSRGYVSYLESVTPADLAAAPPLINNLEAAAERLAPAIVAARRRLREAGAEHILLSGSGPTLFGLAKDEDQARTLARKAGGLPARFVRREEALRLG
ncbi:MAG: 4-(cytidine 5'-diphospho)-2-C-methyl-D-erythritol kinase [Chloroflexota bacterium]|nr:4-(cytidine 5'-diphospho)-2-C-methyl-D-erythritol kinase [Chloroflexota bacterium]